MRAVGRLAAAVTVATVLLAGCGVAPPDASVAVSTTAVASPASAATHAAQPDARPDVEQNAQPGAAHDSPQQTEPHTPAPTTGIRGAQPTAPPAAVTGSGGTGAGASYSDGGDTPAGEQQAANQQTDIASLPAATAAGASDVTAIQGLLATLPIKGRAPKTGYDRALFGPAWSDDVTVDGGHNGCDTRNDILRRDLDDAQIKQGTYGCLVLSGTLHDAYTGKTIDFTRGQVTSQAVQIDHVVAMMDAWQKGAQGMSMNERRDFANDPLNLQAVDGPTNSRKGAGDAATWLPPNKSYRCTYVSRQVQVKAKYRLWVSRAEADAIRRVLVACTAGMTPPASSKAQSAPGGDSPSTPLQGESTAPVGLAQTSVASTAAPLTSPAAPTSAPTSRAAPTVTSRAVPSAPSAPKPGDCFPRSKAGNCYNAGQICAKANRGDAGVAANGSAIRCVDDGGKWRWKNA